MSDAVQGAVKFSPGAYFSYVRTENFPATQ